MSHLVLLSVLLHGPQAPIARIGIPLPPGTLRAADELAAQDGRSRSGIVAEAIRQYAAARARGSVTAVPCSKLARVGPLLNAEVAHYLIIGAKAMQLRGTSCATRDIDIRIAPTVANAERVLRALSARRFGVAAEIDPQDLVARDVTMIGDTPNVDVLTRAWNFT